MILVNGIENATLNPRDRGVAYGDGVFRTFPLRNGSPVLWRRQYAKLAHDSAALGIACPVQTVLEEDLAKIAARHADGVIRITLTRGVAARGYAITDGISATRIVSRSDLSAPAFDVHGGVKARWCSLRLAIQPALAGIKHLNRLENVLARSEWRDPQIAEGLVCDAAGHVIGGTMSNLFLLRDRALTTPALGGCGIAGVMRDVIIERAQADGVSVRIAPILPEKVRAADAVFLVNSVIGVWQVVLLDELTWGTSAFAGTLRDWISDAESR